MTTSKTLWHIDPSRSEIISEEVDQGLAEVHSTRFSMVSTGTEKLVLEGKIPPSMFERMTVPHMKGSFTFPIAYGYSCIVQSHEGKASHLMHPHSSLIQITKEGLQYFDPKVTLHKYALISNMETVVNAIWDAGSLYGKKIAIIGAGNVGGILAVVLKEGYGLDVDVFDINDDRKEKMAVCGISTTLQGVYDTIFHTSASEAGLQMAIDHLVKDGQVIELSWYGTNKVNLQLGENFHYKRISIKASQVSTIPPHMQGDWNFEKRKKYCIEMIEKCPSLEYLIEMVPFSKAESFYSLLRKGKLSGGPIFIFDYSK